eukprot:5046032-Pyramimonas_sp.AAC.1
MMILEWAPRVMSLITTRCCHFSGICSLATPLPSAAESPTPAERDLADSPVRLAVPRACFREQ